MSVLSNLSKKILGPNHNHVLWVDHNHPLFFNDHKVLYYVANRPLSLDLQKELSLFSFRLLGCIAAEFDPAWLTYGKGKWSPYTARSALKKHPLIIDGLIASFKNEFTQNPDPFFLEEWTIKTYGEALGLPTAISFQPEDLSKIDWCVTLSAMLFIERLDQEAGHAVGKARQALDDQARGVHGHEAVHMRFKDVFNLIANAPENAPFHPEQVKQSILACHALIEKDIEDQSVLKKTALSGKPLPMKPHLPKSAY